MHRFKSIVLLAIALLLPAPLMAQEKLKAVATFSILGDLVAKVGGDRIEIKTLVSPGGDAHVYQPTPADAADITNSKIVFQNGLKFEGWMERLIQSSGFKGTLITASKGIKPNQMVEEGKKKEDPHAWQNALNVLTYVTNIKDGLCKVDATGCATFTKNASDYSAEIVKIDSEIKARLATVPKAQRKVITSHDAFGYFGTAYGVKFLAPRGISTESEASAKDVAKLIDQIRKEKVTALFVENIADPRLIEQIARETKVKAGGTIYSDALSKADGPASTYLDMMRHNISLIAAAMAGV